MNLLTGFICKHFRPGESALAAVYPLHSGSWQREPASADGPRADRLPFGDALPKRGDFAACFTMQITMWRSFLVPRRACTHPESGGSRQPLDRQVRYYSESEEVASRVLSTSVAAEGTGGGLRLKNPLNAKAPLPLGVAPWHMNGHWPLEQLRWFVHRFCSYPAGFPSKGPLSGVGSCRALRSSGF